MEAKGPYGDLLNTVQRLFYHSSNSPLANAISID